MYYNFDKQYSIFSCNASNALQVQLKVLLFYARFLINFDSKLLLTLIKKLLREIAIICHINNFLHALLLFKEKHLASFMRELLGSNTRITTIFEQDTYHTCSLDESFCKQIGTYGDI